MMCTSRWVDYHDMQEYDRQQEDAALTDQQKQERQQKADADQAAMWESIGNVGPAFLYLKSCDAVANHALQHHRH